MCGRYRLTTTAAELGRQFQSQVDEALKNQRPRFNVAPTDVMPILRIVGDERWLLPSRWGLVPPWAKEPGIGSTMINARAETAFEKPAFKDALRYQRCLVAVDGVYEWRAGGARKVPYLITFDDDKPVTLGGLWSSWKGDAGVVHSFTILTTAANEQLRPLHDRMPVVVDKGEREAWLDPGRNVVDLPWFSRRRELPNVRYWAVSSRLGNVRNDDESLLVADAELPDFDAAPSTKAGTTKTKKKSTTTKPDQGVLF